MKKISIFACLFIACFSISVFALSTQQYNRIYLEPFYRDSMLGNVNYHYVVNVNPPDKIGKVISAIINFDIYVNPTRNFSLWVNNNTCKNKNYYISTTFANSGQARIMFDCSNVIREKGKYDITLRSDGVNGASNGWLDLTYMNNPVGSAKFSGTDYHYGEIATIFLQLQDASGKVINNASCDFDMYNTTNLLGNPIFWKTPMISMNKDGMYFYQFDTSYLNAGVYPLDAECSYEYDEKYYYHGSLTGQINWITNSGTFQGGNYLSLNFFDDYSYVTWSGIPNITFRIDNINKTNMTKLDLFWLSWSRASRNYNFYAYNYSSNSFQLIGSMTSNSRNDENNKDIFTAELDIDSYVNSSGSMELNVVQVSGTGVILNVDWLTLKAFKNLTYVINVKGSSEVHVYPMNLTCLNSSLLAKTVWEHENRTLTDYNNSEISSEINSMENLIQDMIIGNVSVYALINESKVAEAVWFADVEDYYVTQNDDHEILGGIAFASQDYNSICIDNQTLLNYVMKTRCVGNECKDIQLNTTITCQYGCNSEAVPNYCNPSPSQSSIMFFIIIFIFIVIVGIIISKLR